MNWLKVGAVVVGGIVVFFVVDSVIHLFLGLLSAIVFVAVVGGGVYAASKIIGARRRNREVRQRSEHHAERPPQYEAPRPVAPRPAAPRPAAPRPAAPRPAPADVDDELARLKREMGG